MRIESAFYNYYNIDSRYKCEVPEVPGWKERYAVTEDTVKNINYSQDSDAFKAYKKLDETYYSLGVSNRAKYKTEADVHTALRDKYNLNGNYKGYSRQEVTAMYDNELEMTLFGCLNGGGNVNDPHVNGFVMDPTDNEKKAYSRKMVNKQLETIFLKAGLGKSLLEKYDMKFIIDPFHYTLKLFGVDDEEVKGTIEKILNEDNNARELFYHILHSNSGSLSDDVLTKYHALRDFKSVTGQDLRDYKQTKSGLVNEKGENILDVYKEALKTSNAVPAEFKGLAYTHFSTTIEKLLRKDLYQIPDLNLSIGYKNGSLYDEANEDVVTSRFQAII